MNHESLSPQELDLIERARKVLMTEAGLTQKEVEAEIKTLDDAEKALRVLKEWDELKKRYCRE